MSHLLPPALFTLFAWWLGTGVILWLNRLPRHTYRITFTVASWLAILAFWGLAASRNAATEAGAYGAFSCALLVWAGRRSPSCSDMSPGHVASTCDPAARARGASASRQAGA
jgi:putative photosynthetic complex assembly protein 2